MAPPDNRYLVAAHERSPIGIGLGVLGPAGLKPLVMNTPHMKIHMTMLTMLDPGPMMMLRTLHSNNDSKAKLLPSMRFDLSEDELRTTLRDRFKLDLDTVLAV